jgi:hypothetical protein
MPGYKLPVRTRDEFLSIVGNIIGTNSVSIFDILNGFDEKYNGSTLAYGRVTIKDALSSALRGALISAYKDEDVKGSAGSRIYYVPEDSPFFVPSKLEPASQVIKEKTERVVPVPPVINLVDVLNSSIVSETVSNELESLLKSVAAVQTALISIKDELHESDQELLELQEKRAEIDMFIEDAKQRKQDAVNRYASFRQQLSLANDVIATPSSGHKHVPAPPLIRLPEDKSPILKNGVWLWYNWARAVANTIKRMDPDKFGKAHAIVGSHIKRITKKGISVPRWDQDEVAQSGIPAIMQIEDMFKNAHPDEYEYTSYYQEEKALQLVPSGR